MPTYWCQFRKVFSVSMSPSVFLTFFFLLILILLSSAFFSDPLFSSPLPLNLLPWSPRSQFTQEILSFYPPDTGYPSFCWGSWNICSWVLCRVGNKDQVHFLYVQLSSVTSTICWVWYSYQIGILVLFVKNQVKITVYSVYFFSSSSFNNGLFPCQYHTFLLL